MIELNEKTQQDFLNREWVQKLLNAGVDMSDAKYCIYFNMTDGKDYISLSEKIYGNNCLPTYTVSELLNKLWNNKIGKFHMKRRLVLYIFSIESLASLLIQCYQKDIGNINDK